MIPSPVSKAGYAPVLAGTVLVACVLHAWLGPGDANVYQPPGGVFVHAPEATSDAAPLQQIFGAVIPMKSEAIPLRLVGAPVTQMFVLFGPLTGSLLQGLTCPPVFCTWQ